LEGVEEWLTCNQVVKGSNNGSRDYLMDMKVIRHKECRDMGVKAGRRAWVCLDRECKVSLQVKAGKGSGCLDIHQGKAGKDSEYLDSHQAKAGKDSEDLDSHQAKAGKDSEDQVSHQGKVVQDSEDQVSHQGKVVQDSEDQVSHQGKVVQDSGDQVSHQAKAVQGNSKDSRLLPHHLQTGYQNILVLNCSQ